MPLQAVNRLVLARGVQRTKFRFGRRPVADAERLARMSVLPVTQIGREWP
jgi:hypothetical protein